MLRTKLKTIMQKNLALLVKRFGKFLKKKKKKRKKIWKVSKKKKKNKDINYPHKSYVNKKFDLNSPNITRFGCVKQ